MNESSIPTAMARAAARRAAHQLAAEPRVRLVVLFGSAADPTRPSVRDIDLAVLAEPRIPADELLALRADLVTLSGCTIDLVDIATASTVLAWEIADTGECLFARTPDDQAAFVTRARSRYWDFKPYLDAQWRLTGERLEERRRGPAS